MQEFPKEPTTPAFAEGRAVDPMDIRSKVTAEMTVIFVVKNIELMAIVMGCGNLLEMSQQNMLP